MKSSLYLRSLERLRECAPGYPGDTAVLRRFSRLDFSAPVTMLCGDNGCGKTTLIELLACKVRANRIGPPQGALTGSQRAVAAAADDFHVVMGGRPAHSFLFTAEGFSQYVATLTAEKEFARAELDGLSGKYGSDYARSLAAQPFAGTLAAIDHLYAAPLETQSHGQGFLDFFQSRLMPGGLYLMDEPEAALSHVNQLALIYLMQDAVSDGCQFVLATHSPILTACPGAAIYEIDEGRLTPTDYEHLSSVQFLSHFLKAHAHLLGAK